MMKGFPILLISITFLLLQCDQSMANPAAKPQKSAKLLDPGFFEKKTESQNAELEKTCSVRMKTDRSEEGDAVEFCKYRDNYREAINNLEEYNEVADNCNTILCTWFQNECYKYKKVENQSGNNPEEKTCKCLTNTFEQGNCTKSYIHSADADELNEAGLGNRVSEEAEELHKEEVLQALKDLDNLSPDKYSAEEQKCFAEKKVFYQGSCYKLHDKKACGQNEWLILRKPARDLIRPVCKRNRCKSNEVYSTDLRRCLPNADFRKRFCDTEGFTAGTDAYGDGTCVCSDNYESFKDKEGCYELYQTGPCGADEVVTYNHLTGFAQCSPDLCLSQNNGAIANHNRYRHTRITRQLDDGISFHQERKIFAPLDGVGQCYTLSGPRPCVKTDAYARFVINKETKLPSCTVFTALLHLIDGPSKCITDESNRCRNVITLVEENQLEYLLSIKNQKRRNRNSKGK